MINVTKSGSSDVTVSPARLTFTTANWGTAQTVTVSAAQDADAVNDAASIAHAVVRCWRPPPPWAMDAASFTASASCAARTVTVCAVSQLAVVKVRVAGDTVTSELPLLVTPITTLEVG